MKIPDPNSNRQTASQSIQLLPTLRLSIVRTAEAVVLRAERRSSASTDPDDWSPDLRALPIPLEHITELLASIELVARGQA